jgi:hypothetical protein
MLSTAFAPHASLQDRGRVPAISRAAEISAGEVVCLLACGALAAAAIGFVHLSLRTPGHAILRGVLPMAIGFALVPRYWAGTLMAIGAAITSTAMSAVHLGSFPASAMLSVLALGPVLDLALLGRPHGWRLYARFIIAGVIANVFAYGLKVAGVALGIGMFGGGREFQRFALPVVLSSYILCGALAGLFGAAACFRARGRDDLRRD